MAASTLHQKCFLLFGIAAVLSALQLHGQEGPGFPNLDYLPSEEGSVLSLNDPGKAISSVAMHRGYLFVPLGADHGGGQGNGAFAFYDISNPAQPVVFFDSRDHPAVYHDSSSFHYVGDWAELHHIAISEDYVMITERRFGSAGYSIIDMAPLFDNDPETIPQVVSRFSYPGVTNPSNYDGYSFAAGWQGQKIFWGPTGSNGLMIVDSSDFGQPELIATIPRSQLNNRTLRSAVPIGNLLVLTTVATAGDMECLLLDISNPAEPTIINSFSGPLGYQAFTYGGKVYGGGSPLVEHDFTDPSNIVHTVLNENPGFDRSEYGFGKDGDLFVGHYPGLTRWDLNGGTATQVQAINSGLLDDHAFITPIGNLAAITSDHNNDRKLILGIHDSRKDVTPPSVNFTSPADGETGVHLKSRVGLSFTDFLDATTVNENTLLVREIGGSTAVEGTFTTLFGIVNFAPDNDLEPDTTYEVVVQADGIADQSGNRQTVATTAATFSTGSSIQTYSIDVMATSAVEVGATVELSIAVDNPLGLALEHSFDFGDGTAASPFAPARSASHTYSDAGNHLLSVATRVVGTSNARSVTAVQVVHHPLPAQAPSQSSTIVYDAVHGLIWNVNADNDSITALDSGDHSMRYEIAVGDHPKSLAISSVGELWVVNKGSASISVIDPATGHLARTISLPSASAPHGIVFDSGSNRAFVSLEALGEIAVLDSTSGSLLRRISVGPWPRHLALDPSRAHLWISRFISPDESGLVYRLDTNTLERYTATELDPVMEPDSLSNGRGIPNYLGALALSTDLTQGYIPAKKDNIFRGTSRDGLELTFEHTVRSMASRLDLVLGVEDPESALDFDNNDFATAVAFSPLGNQIFFTTNGSALVWVVDAFDPSNSFTFSSGGHAPDGLVISPDGSRLYVHNLMSRDVSVFDISTTCSSACGSSPLVATRKTVTNESLSPEVLLGKRLFYDSSDPRLSQESYMSCASCHLDGGHDGRVWDFTGMGEGLRNTIDLNGRGLGHGPLHWTANFDEVHDFENQIRGLSGGSGLLSDNDFHSGNREPTLGATKEGISEELDALAAYLASLTSVGTSPHRQADGSLTPDALLGREVFRKTHCASCHSGTAFSDSASRSLHDVGTLQASSGSRMGEALKGLDTPTLRGLWQTAPYLHDGSAATLREVLVEKNISGKHGNLFSLDEAEVNQLVAYLNQIDDHELAAPQGTDAPAVALINPGSQLSELSRALTLPLAVANGGEGSLRYQATGLPEGLAIDSETGVIRGAPGRTGNHTVRVGVRDSAGNSDSITIPWTVTAQGQVLSEHAAEITVGPYRFLRLRALNEVANGPWASIAELNLYGSDRQTLDRSGWSVFASSEERVGANNRATQAIDGNVNTLWHSEWNNGPDEVHPHDFIVDLGEEIALSGLSYLARNDSRNGRIDFYEIAGSNDALSWVPITEGRFLNSTLEQTTSFSSLLGGLTYERWSSFFGSSIDELRALPTFPNQPTASRVQPSAQAPSNQTENYGARLHGYLAPSATGFYSFAIASDDSSELWLASDQNPRNATLIARNPNAVSRLEWGRNPVQQSSDVFLEAGHLYYLSALHQEGFGDDHLAVGWKLASDANFAIIPGTHLLPYFEIDTPTAASFSESAYQFTVSESAPLATSLGTLETLGPENQEALTYAIIAGNHEGTFRIDAQSGEIFVNGQLDFESRSSYQLLVQVEDGSSPFLAAAVPVSILVRNVLESNREVVYYELTKAGGVFEGYGNPALIAFDADPDGDGIANALEVLQGTSANHRDVPNGPRIGFLLEDGVEFVTYEIEVASDIDGRLEFSFMGGDNLQDWVRLSNEPVLISDNGEIRTYRVRSDLSIAEAPRQFVRLLVNSED